MLGKLLYTTGLLKSFCSCGLSGRTEQRKGLEPDFISFIIRKRKNSTKRKRRQTERIYLHLMTRNEYITFEGQERKNEEKKENV